MMQDVVECRGVRIPKDSRFISGKVEKRLQREMYETPEVLGLSRFIAPEDRVLELGAGIGFVSSFMATALNVRDMTCVEANPELCGYIERVHELNGIDSAQVDNAVALSDAQPWPSSGTLPFYVTDPFWASSLSEPRGKSWECQDVPTVRLSALVERAKPSVIVCDIEGGEAELFEDVDLTGVRGVYMELHTRRYGGAGIRKVFDDMHRLGFFYHQKVSCGDVVLFERLKVN